MTLHVSTMRPPSEAQVRRARAFDAALAEGGYPNECVSVTEQSMGVSRSHPGCDDPGYVSAVKKASTLIALMPGER